MEQEVFDRPIRLGDIVASYRGGSYKGLYVYIVVGFTAKNVKCCSIDSSSAYAQLRSQVCIIENASKFLSEEQKANIKTICTHFKIDFNA